MRRGPDPFRDVEELTRRVYAFVAYRLGDGPEAEDVTSETFARALRFRNSFDPALGPPVAWLIGIARRLVADSRSAAVDPPVVAVAALGPRDEAADAAERLTLAAAVARLDERDRELISLRYGADLTAAQIGRLLELRTNAVEVALHRALGRLRRELVVDVDEDAAPRPRAVRNLAVPPVFAVRPSESVEKRSGA